MAHGKAIQYRAGGMCLQSISGNTPAKGDIVSLGKKCMEGSDAYDRVFTFPHPGKCFSSLLRLRYENAAPNFCWASVHCWASCAIIKRGFFSLHVSTHVHLPRFEALAYVLRHFDALTHMVISVSSAFIFQTFAEVCYSVSVRAFIF